MKSKQIYIGLTCLIIGTLYFLYQYDANVYFKILKYWPIFILLSGIFIEFVALNSHAYKLFFFLSGILIVYGLMYTINIYREFYYFSSHISIFFLSLSLGLLNYYIFGSKNNYILSIVLLLILISIFIFLFPIYERYFPIISFKTLVPILLIIIGFILILNGFINKQ